MNAPSRTAIVSFNDACLSVWEEPGGRVTADWELQFKRDVFARIVQQLNRLGWACVVPERMVKQYGRDFARRFRFCTKGQLQAELSVSGRQIRLEFWQDVLNVGNRNGGRYDSDKERRMPYLMRIEMERTRRRIRDYLCSVFDGYQFKPERKGRGLAGLTALAWIEQEVRKCWHFNPSTGRRSGEDLQYNSVSADGGLVRHGDKVWVADQKGRLITGTTFYNINNMWWVITGRYDCRNVASFEIYTQQPDQLRVRRNANQRARRLREELQAAVDNLQFERAAVLRDILHPMGPPVVVREAA